MKIVYLFSLLVVPSGILATHTSTKKLYEKQERTDKKQKATAKKNKKDMQRFKFVHAPKK